MRLLFRGVVFTESDGAEGRTVVGGVLGVPWPFQPKVTETRMDSGSLLSGRTWFTGVWL